MKNLRTYLAAFTASAAVLLTGCNLSENTNTKNKDNTTTTKITEKSVDMDTQNQQENNSETYFNIQEETILNDKEKEVLKTTINYDESLEETLKIIDSWQNSYEYEKYYLIDDSFNSYQQRKNVNITNTKSIIENNKVNREKLLQSLYLNSEDTISKDLIKRISEIVADAIDYILEQSEIDIKEVEHKLELLKIDDKTSFSYASYSPLKQTMSINEETIKLLAKQNNLPEEEVFRRNVEHETNHMIQSDIYENLEENSCELINGPCYKDKKLKVNSMYWDWFVESTAEDMTVIKNNYNGPLTYNVAIEALKSLKTITIFLDDKDEKSLNKVGNSHDINDLFNYFEVTTEEEKREILNMMYSINIFTNRDYISTTEDFYKYYQEKEGYRPIGNDKELIEASIEKSVVTTQSKLLYKNLIKDLKDKSYILEDLFHIMSIHEDFVNIYTYYGYNGCSGLNEEYFDNYCKVQASFIEIISKQTGYSKEDIQNLYDRYHIDYHDDFSTLNKNENDFYQTYEKELSPFRSNSINYVHSLTKNKSMEM